MTDKKGTPRGNVKHEKVVLEKIGPHVEVHGPYTKRGLRKLLLSSTSLYPDKDNEKETLEKDGINKKDLKKIKDGQQPSEKTQKALQDLEIDMILKAKSKTTKDYLKVEETEKIEEKGKKTKEDKGEKDTKDFYEKGKIDKSLREKKKAIGNAKENFIQLLKQKEISEELMSRILKNGLTEETIRLLKSLGFSAEDLENLQKLWQIQLIEIEENDSSKSEISEPSSSDEYMSLDSLYLKSYISIPIKEALRQIILRKPKDPVEFLGQWLLHFKVCEEREKKRKECETELTLEREALKLKEKSEIETTYYTENAEDEKEGETEEIWQFF